MSIEEEEEGGEGRGRSGSRDRRGGGTGEERIYIQQRADLRARSGEF